MNAQTLASLKRPDVPICVNFIISILTSAMRFALQKGTDCKIYAVQKENKALYIYIERFVTVIQKLIIRCAIVVWNKFAGKIS